MENKIKINYSRENNKCWWGCEERGTLYSWWGCRLVQPLGKAVWSYLQKLKVELSYDPVILLLGIYPKKPKTRIWKNIRTLMFIAALFIIARLRKQPKCPSVDEWMKQLWDIYTMEYYSAINKKKVLLFATAWIDLENIRLSDRSQSEKDSNTIWFH